MIHKRAVFFDRDGTLLVPQAEYISNPDQVVFYKGAPEALALLKERGLRRIVVTNQAGVGRGILSEMDLLRAHNHMKRVLQEQDADLDAVFYAPHFPASARPEHRRRAGERKPSTQLFEQAALRYQLSLKDSFVVGDRLEDLQAARNIGAKAVLVRTGKGSETERGAGLSPGPDFVADDAAAAVVWICRQVGDMPLSGKKILFVLAGRDFQEREYLAPRLRLEGWGAGIAVAGPASETPALGAPEALTRPSREDCVGAQGLRIRPDVTHADAGDEFDAVVFIGGEGARALAGCKRCQALARRAYESKRVVAAICVAPSILANAHLLSRKTAVAWHTELPTLRRMGARVSRHPVARDGAIVTAAGPRDAVGFADAIRAALLGEKENERTVSARAETTS